MPRLKTYLTQIGFYETAVAATSQPKALEAWGLRQNLFADGTAKVTDKKDIVEAALSEPGTVFVRPVGSKGAFKPEEKSTGVPKLPKGTRKPVKAKKRGSDREAVAQVERSLKRAKTDEREQLKEIERLRAQLAERESEAKESYRGRVRELKAKLKKARK